VVISFQFYSLLYLRWNRNTIQVPYDMIYTSRIKYMKTNILYPDQQPEVFIFLGCFYTSYSLLFVEKYVTDRSVSDYIKYKYSWSGSIAESMINSRVDLTLSPLINVLIFLIVSCKFVSIWKTKLSTCKKLLARPTLTRLSGRRSRPHF